MRNRGLVGVGKRLDRCWEAFAPSCDLASKGSLLRSSGNLIASRQVHLALTQPAAYVAGESLGVFEKS